MNIILNKRAMGRELGAQRRTAPGGDGRLQRLDKATRVGGLAFLMVLSLVWMFHPLLLARHPGRVLAQCAEGALMAFFAGWLVYVVKAQRN